jgi:predicted ribosomally synthesized peptide with SipW-like signal peptide
MRALLMSLMVVALVGGLVGGGMFAYFNDTETSTGNTFTAGTIDIDLTGDNVISNAGQTEFKPCEWGYLTKTITNVGQNPAKVWKHIISLTGDQGTSSEPELEAEAGGEILPTAADFNFDLTVTKYDADDNMIGTPDVIIADPGVSLEDVICKWIELGTLEPGEYFVVEQSFHLLDTGVAQNGLQGDIALIDEEFEARQVVGNPGTPTPLY